MPRFNVNKLVVLHLYNYIRPRGEKDPLVQIEKECQVIKLSTCMRTIYVLNSDALSSERQQEAYQSLVSFIEKRDIYSTATKFERLTGTEAYQFLLYWILGGVNPKSTFHDCRILGDVRAIWNKMLVSPSERVHSLVGLYRSFFNDLFTDSTNLNKLITVYEHLELDALKDTLQIACRNCAWARVNDFLLYIAGFDYRHFAENSHLVALEKAVEYCKQKLVKQDSALTLVDIGLFKVPEELEKQRSGIRQRMFDIRNLVAVLASIKVAPVLASDVASTIDEASSAAVLKAVQATIATPDDEATDLADGMRLLFG